MDNTENSNPNMNPLKNLALTFNKNERPNQYSQPSESSDENKATIKPYNYSEQDWQGNLSNNKYPSELGYSPIGRPYGYQTSENTPSAPPKQPIFEGERIRGIRPTHLDWTSNDSKSQPLSPNAVDEDEEEQEPRQMPIHIINHMAQANAQKPQYQTQYQIPQARSPPKPT